MISRARGNPGDDDVVVIDREPYLFCMCKTSLLSALLAVRIRG